MLNLQTGFYLLQAISNGGEIFNKKINVAR